jgi:hypothetical protein
VIKKESVARQYTILLATLSFYVEYHYAEIAPVGHVSAHAPQSMHVSGSIS